MFYGAISRRAENSPQRGEYRRSRTPYSFLLSNQQTDVRPTEKAGRCTILCRSVIHLQILAAVWRVFSSRPLLAHRQVANALATPKFSEMREEGRQPVIARREFRTSGRVGVPTAPTDAEHRTGNGAIFPALHGSVACHLTC